mgnify:CR=1 FL=1
MKACIIQPSYSFDKKDLETRNLMLIDLLSECDSSMDIIVLPEYSDALADVPGKEEFYSACEKYGKSLLAAASETAKRCSAYLFVNAGYKTCSSAIVLCSHNVIVLKVTNVGMSVL